MLKHLQSTTVVISDPDLVAKLASLEGLIIFRGPGGKCLRLGELVPPDRLPSGIKSPISDEEFEEARKQPDSGIPLAEFWKRVERGEYN